MAPCLSETEFELFRHLIKKHVGISFSGKKKATLQRKLASRLSHLGLESYEAYYRYLLHDKQGGWELRQLINTITVDQTAFFRHAEQFEFLANVILPQIATQKKTTKKLRIWSAGCSTGQEAYSMDIIFCRNVMIYFHAEVKKELIENFFRVLERDGFGLCLGASESLVGIDEPFALVGHSTYQKKG